MLKREVRQWVKYLIGERKSFKVIFANDQVEVVGHIGYCWVIGSKPYSDEELVEKMVRFQNNEKKFIIKFEEIEEVVEEVAVEEVEEEVENLNDDLFQESDIAYAEEAIEREMNKKEIDKMLESEKELMKIIESRIEYKVDCLNWRNEDIGLWLDSIIFALGNPSYEFSHGIQSLRDYYLGLESGKYVSSNS